MQTPAPIRITIDFREALHPARGWILGRVDGAQDRVDVLAFGRATRPALETAADAECTCPAFCDRDHDLD